MSNNKILYITPVLVPGSSAASKRILANAKLLQLLNYDVSIYSGLNFTNATNVDGIKLLPSGIDIENTKGTKKLIGYKKSVLHFIKSLNSQDTSNIKAIIVYSGYSFYLFPLLKWSKKNKIPLVFDAVEWYTPQKKYHWLLKPYYWNTELAMRYFIPKTKNVIAISTYLEEYYKSKKCNTVVIPPLYYPKTFIVENRERDYLKLSYTGSPGKKDELNQVLNAILALNDDNNVKEIYIEIAGINEKELLSYSAFKDREISILPKNINAHGYISLKLAQQITSNSDFSILFRKNNKTNTAGFPTKVVESLSLSTPIFMNYSSDLYKYLHNYKNAIIVDDFKVETIKAALIEMMKIRRVNYLMMRKEAFNTAENYFLFSTKTEVMSTFFKNLKI